MNMLLNYRKEDWNTLKTVSRKTNSWAPNMVRFNCHILLNNKSAGNLIKPKKQLDIKSVLEKWNLKLVHGGYQKNFWHQHWILGLLFIQNGVNYEFLRIMMKRMNKTFLKKCLEIFYTELAFEVYSAYHRIMGAAISLISEVYHSISLKSIIRLDMNETLIKQIIFEDIKKRLKQF